jgi:hypothetical protein
VKDGAGRGLRPPKLGDEIAGFVVEPARLAGEFAGRFEDAERVGLGSFDDLPNLDASTKKPPDDHGFLITDKY